MLFDSDNELVMRLSAFLNFNFLFRVSTAHDVSDAVYLGLRHVYPIEHGDELKIIGVCFLKEPQTGVFHAISSQHQLAIM